ncbi:chemotaxis protein [Marinibactrum halimedae]|uniref:Chemotaxis protein CheW n=1 Tax=Marinibactrum halimedae TaxID=1444977 RepID=A0AA37T6G8_9GAMM|nr:chemotaxis protein [Marinibactrum halimedae]MCD9458503.1 chemotaxis protein [Marinibactrum halimedae]GLS26634.1 chemotaxis protein CheW [Marinibactrum halimedae]
MSKLLHSIDQRTKLVGENRLELLLFNLGSQQPFAINVFKVREVMQLPALTAMPQRHHAVCGVAHIRGTSFPVIDLRAALGRSPLYGSDATTNLIITEYNLSVQGFLVGEVDRIINLNWEEILPPPATSGKNHFLTALTKLDDRIVQIVDVEKVLADISPYHTNVSSDLLNEELRDWAEQNQVTVLLVDDSATARQQASATLANLGVRCIQAGNGAEGLALLKKMSTKGAITDQLLMLITDAEMPEMDGYRLTSEIRQDPNLSPLYVVMHTSLSGNFNKALVDKVGCDDFLSKFQPDELAAKVQDQLGKWKEEITRQG